MSSNESTQAIALKQGVRPYQLAIGFVVSVAMLVLGTTGIAGATNGSAQAQGSATIAKEDCKGNGWRELGFASKQDCKDAIGQEMPGGGNGNGYGGNNGNNIGLDLEVNGDNNVINVIINFLFG